MDILVYKYMHVVAIIMLFLAFGGLIQGAWLTQNRVFPHKKIFVILHGLGMFLILLSGFGQLARLGMTGSWPMWVTVKLVIWFILGGLIVPILRKPLLNYYMWLVALLLGSTAIYMAVFKPF